MKVFRFEESEKVKKLYTLQMSFDKKTGVLSGTVGTSGTLRGVEGDLILDFSVDLNDWKGKILDLYILATESGYEVRAIDIMKNCNLANGMPAFFPDPYETQTRVFRCAVREKLNDTIINIAHAHEAIEGFTDGIIPENYAPLRLKALCDLDGYAAELVAKYRKKSDMQNKIDFKDSIAYLEAQLDLLTRFILTKHPEETGEIVEALKLADGQSVLDIKDMASVEREFTEKKALVRKAQKEYFDAEESAETANS